MKIVSGNTKRTYHIDIRQTSGEERLLCPECSQGRKKSTDKCLAWDISGKKGYCHHCNTPFFVFTAGNSEKQYFIPEWKNKTDLSNKAVRWFEGRMIKQSVLMDMKIYSDSEFMPQFNKKVDTICFPYFLDGKLINTKFRGPNKSFKMVTGAELIFWNIDSIIDHDEVIITEGEIDALCFIQTGFSYCLSVPNGANTKSMEYLDSCIDLIASKNKIYLAVDNDLKGIALRDELARRIGYEKCYSVNFRDCKDANEYLMKHGPDFMTLLPEAKLIKIKGVNVPVDLYNETREYYNIGVQKGLIINIDQIDEYITWETGRLAIVTGIPSHGKSSFVDYLCTKLNIIYNWKVAYFTPENYPLKYHLARLLELITGKKFGRASMDESTFDQAFDYIDQNFRYILNEDDFSLKTILDLSKYLVRSFGIKILVIDPYNKIEHKFEKWENETQYISRILDDLITFAKYYQVLVFLVAHPRKMELEGSNHKCPTLYDISGSAHFYNKCDYGFTVYRLRDSDRTFRDEVEVHWQKIKYKNLGMTGISELAYNRENGRFESKDTKNWDDQNWLVKEKQQDIWTSVDEKEVPF